ncbi:Thyroid receptor-interacting protein 6 [Blastocladiella emersonii ATCC 22665]|nr:Thyroid receptor-interacting protein 6 [Blastocladiella emersonii ATCC 22665]
MPFCQDCGEIIRAGSTACAACGGAAKESLSSGFSAHDAPAAPATASARAFDMRPMRDILSPPGSPSAARKVAPPPVPVHKPVVVHGIAPRAAGAPAPVPPRPTTPPKVGASPAVPATKPVFPASIPATKPLYLSSAVAAPSVPATKPVFARPSPAAATPTLVGTSPAKPVSAPLVTAPAAPAKHHPLPSASTAPSHPPVNARAHDDDERELRCTMCYDRLSPEKARRTRERPDEPYCLSCWAVRPVPDVSSSGAPAAGNAREVLDYQTQPQRGTAPTAYGTCAACTKPLGLGTHTIALGKEFHAACFVCLACGQPPGDQFVDRAGKPLCLACHAAEVKAKAEATASAPRTTVTVPGVFANRAVCGKCAKPIFTAIVTLAGGETRCTDCFVCHKCKLPIDGSYATENGEIMHPDCQTRELCAKCTFPITGAFVRIKSGTVHSGCFRCASCSIELAGKAFAVVDGKETCAECLNEAK